MPAPPRDELPSAPRLPLPAGAAAVHGVPGTIVEPSGAPRPSLGNLDYQAGDIIARKYRLTRVLGEGGMGAVWLARNVKLDVDVAIKLIRHELATDETSRRLLQEARAAARIGHRSIVRVFDFGETELDDPFIVMEVLAGESLRDVLEQRGRLTATNAVRTLLPIASALVEAHASGIVHRDLKPENVMLVPDTSGGAIPKLVDFGIAKFRRGDGGDDPAAGNMVVGTPDYMSPEQAGGRDEVDEGTDVWALAVILYEAITGSVPFAGQNYAALIFSIMADEPKPIDDELTGDAELWGIVQGALAKQSAGRPSMRAFGAMLAEWAIARGIDSDIAGTSLAAHWIVSSKRNPFSAAPPPLSGKLTRFTLRRGAVGLAVAAVAVALTVIVISRRNAATARPALETAAAPTATPSPASSLPMEGPSGGPGALVPSTLAPPEPSTMVSAAPEPVAATASAPSAVRSGARFGSKKQSTRNSKLTIAKEPNF